MLARRIGGLAVPQTSRCRTDDTPMMALLIMASAANALLIPTLPDQATHTKMLGRRAVGQRSLAAIGAVVLTPQIAHADEEVRPFTSMDAFQVWSGCHYGRSTRLSPLAALQLNLCCHIALTFLSCVVGVCSYELRRADCQMRSRPGASRSLLFSSATSRRRSWQLLGFRTPTCSILKG